MSGSAANARASPGADEPALAAQQAELAADQPGCGLAVGQAVGRRADERGLGARRARRGTGGRRSPAPSRAARPARGRASARRASRSSSAGHVGRDEQDRAVVAVERCDRRGAVGDARRAAPGAVRRAPRPRARSREHARAAPRRARRRARSSSAGSAGAASVVDDAARPDQSKRKWVPTGSRSALRDARDGGRERRARRSRVDAPISRTSSSTGVGSSGLTPLA